jgi:hypothetical protein
MSIFTCLNDPDTGPRMRAAGVTEAGLVRYILDRAKGIGEHEALFKLLHAENPKMQDAEFVEEIVPIPTP